MLDGFFIDQEDGQQKQIIPNVKVQQKSNQKAKNPKKKKKFVSHITVNKFNDKSDISDTTYGYKGETFGKNGEEQFQQYNFDTLNEPESVQLLEDSAHDPLQ